MWADIALVFRNQVSIGRGWSRQNNYAAKNSGKSADVNISLPFWKDLQAGVWLYVSKAFSLNVR